MKKKAIKAGESFQFENLHDFITLLPPIAFRIDRPLQLILIFMRER